MQRLFKFLFSVPSPEEGTIWSKMAPEKLARLRLILWYSSLVGMTIGVTSVLAYKNPLGFIVAGIFLFINIMVLE